ncbi:flavin monoamine oxidase family protein [Sulfitobacter sp. F26169L]|uniref:flavin monoamine oxidase family protein n=1 Tax=Sulfitobacter sp. F26169L TaxID=2996015 RepID=UPI002260B6B6|nr:flavin monoamine oxidase family protein [Sulfitobacter sp. F26169L]MCX7567472.1 flavin monoamine oxidase family protein [Sulfitobacter sp. F26169L]
MSTVTRRNLLGMIGTVAGSTAMYHAMAAMGHAQQSSYTGPIKLDGAPQGTKILILGAGLAGMTAALEMRAAGYEVEVLEFREKAGGRCWTLRGGDTYTELGGAVQNVDFAEGNYINPGPWRIPYHHHAVLDYCGRLGVQLEPFVQENYQAYLHRSDVNGGARQRVRDVKADYRGHVSELLSKAAEKGRLDDMVTEEDREILIESLRDFGGLTDAGEYKRGAESAELRGYDRWAGAGADGAPIPSDPVDRDEVLRSRYWEYLAANQITNHQATMFQPVGGMDSIARGFEREVGDLITYNAKVTALQQDENGVTVTWTPTEGGEQRTSTADYCVCTIPFSILSQIDHNLSSGISNAISEMPYNGSVKWGLEFKRRFWEQDDRIYGGVSFTDQAIGQISYPSTGYLSDGPGVLLGGYTWRGPESYKFNAMQPEERIEWALRMGEKIHPQYRDEYKTGVTVSWHKVPWVLGCSGLWNDRERDYADAIKVDNRVVCAGEHLSYLPAWQEGAILSSLDAIGRLHSKIVQG